MKRRPKLLVVGSMVMDLIVSTTRFPQSGETVLGLSYQSAPGGKGANQAVQAARLGADVTMVGKVGKDAFGDILLESAKASGVDVSHVLRSENQPSAVGNVQLEVGVETTANRIIVVPGANMDITPADVSFLKEEIAQYDLVLLQLEIPMEINILVASYAAENKVPVMLNCAPIVPLPDELLQNVTFLSPNEHEAHLLTGIEVNDEESIRQAIAVIEGMGVDNVLITLGARGVAYDDGNELIFSPALKNLNVKDTTAAGDSFVGSFSTAIAAGMSIKDSLMFANHTAAITVCRMGAQPSLPTYQEVKALLHERNVENLALEQCSLEE